VGGGGEPYADAVAAEYEGGDDGGAGVIGVRPFFVDERRSQWDYPI
jgi:hypothetical protein